MTTAQLDRHGARMGFATLHGLNLFSLQLFLPAHVLPAWLLVAIPLAGGAGVFFLVGRIYRANPATIPYATKLTDSVPGIREFPAVYAYLLTTAAVFVLSLSVAVRHAA